MTPPDYLWVYVIFVCLAIALLILLGIGAALRSTGKHAAQIRQRVRSAALLLFGWMAMALVLAGLGLFESGAAQTFPFIAVPVLLPMIVGAVLIRRSAAVAEILQAVPQSWLVGVQGYRGFGAIFLVLLGTGHLPEVFALPAGFGDVLVGLGALLVAAAYAAGYTHRRGLVLLWNVLGIADLVVAVGTGFLSSPTPLQMLAFDHPNVIAGAFPLVMIPIFAVPLSILLHISSLTKLSRQKD